MPSPKISREISLPNVRIVLSSERRECVGAFVRYICKNPISGPTKMSDGWAVRPLACAVLYWAVWPLACAVFYRVERSLACAVQVVGGTVLDM